VQRREVVARVGQALLVAAAILVAADAHGPRLGFVPWSALIAAALGAVAFWRAARARP